MSPRLQGPALQLHPPVILEEVDGPEGGPVAAGGPDGGQAPAELVRVHVPQHLPAEAGRHLAHLPGDGGVVGGEVGVAGPAVDDAQGVAQGVQIRLDLPQGGGGGVLEVDGDNAAGGAGELVHQPAGLAEVGVLRVLADLGQLGGGQRPAAEEVVEDGGYQDLEGGGGAQAAAPEDPGGGVGVKAPHLVAQLADSGCHPPDQGHGVPRLLRTAAELVQVHLRHPVVAGLDTDGPAAVGHHTGDGVQVHAGGQAVAVLVVGVVAPQLRAAGGGEKQGLRVVIAGEGLLKLQRQLPQPVGRRRRVLAVDRRQPVQQRPALQGPQQVSSPHGIALHPLNFCCAGCLEPKRSEIFLQNIPNSCRKIGPPPGGTGGILFIVPPVHRRRKAELEFSGNKNRALITGKTPPAAIEAAGGAQRVEEFPSGVKSCAAQGELEGAKPASNPIECPAQPCSARRAASAAPARGTPHP